MLHTSSQSDSDRSSSVSKCDKSHSPHLPKCNSDRSYDVIILGSGPAGFTAGIYALRANLKTLLITGRLQGGQLINTLEIENWPGEPKDPRYRIPGVNVADNGLLSGFKLMERMQYHYDETARTIKKENEHQAKNKNCEHMIESRNAVEVILGEATSKVRRKIYVKVEALPFDNEHNKSGWFCSDALIIATGSTPNMIKANVLDEDHQPILDKHGNAVTVKDLYNCISTCATCDGNVHRGENIAVVGGGNVAIGDALYLSSIAKEINLIHRQSKFTRPERFLLHKLFKYAIDENYTKESLTSEQSDNKGKNIKIHTPYEIENIIISKTPYNGGDYKLIRLELKSPNNHNRCSVKCDALFVAIGHSPNTAIFEHLGICKDGHIEVVTSKYGYNTQTKIPGIFAAGDVIQNIYKQAITSAASGCMAALDVQHYLMSDQEHKEDCDEGSISCNFTSENKDIS